MGAIFSLGLGALIGYAAAKRLRFSSVGRKATTA